VTFLGFETRSFPEGTHTVGDAAAAIGVQPAQIVKSIVLRRDDGAGLLVVASGTNRIDLEKVAALAGGTVAMAPARWVKETTGFSIGGVPPAGHATPLETLVDPDLLAFDVVWAAAGSPYEVFPVTPDGLVALTGGRVADVAER
jgi:prolyl-tRNA editing enzyme YbaK/EbsC (Cys-tRNA(Pro) deacylase)